MRTPRALAIGAALTAVASLLSAGASISAAAVCRHPFTSYDRGGTPAGGPVNDPLFEQQWGLRRVKAADAWKRGATGKGAVIAILDTGIDLGHPDLRARLVRGVDLTDEPGCPGPHDESGHGTAVAGVAAATADNQIGIAGVAPGARLMPVRVITGREGGIPIPDEIESVNNTFAKGIRWATDHGADVINISSTLMLVTDLPGDGLKEALEYAWDEGVVIVAAAGNQFSFPICDYPANDAHVVCVGATDELGLPTYYSNQPLNSNSRVGLRAPGGRGIPSCYEPSDVLTTSLPGECPVISGYATMNGTSFASPHVAGVAALLAGEGLTNEEIVDCLTATAMNPLTGLRGESDPIYGYGEVDAGAAAQECA